MSINEGVTKTLEALLAELLVVLNELKAEAKPPADTFEPETFFKEIRPFFGGRLTKGQVSGMEAKLKAFKEAGFPVSHAAYALATSYHETATRMLPVRERLNASDRWRKANLRYYPWYGRGDVQLTWKENYEKADKELGLSGALVKDPDLALDPMVSAKVLVRGMAEGWFSGDKIGRHTLVRHLPSPVGTKAEFKQARRIINLMDKADLISGHAMAFQEALRKAKY